MTHDHAFPYYRTPDEIREQEFAHRMRGLDEYEVREFLDLLADQVRASEAEGAEYRAEIERLRGEVKRLQEQEPQRDADEISPQAVMLFSQAQQVADQLVEEAVRHARDMMTSARNQQREILQRAHEAAENAVRTTEAVPDREPGQVSAASAQAAAEGYTRPVKEIEYVRTFARVAQVQLRSVLEALTEQVDKLGELPRLPQSATESESATEHGGAAEYGGAEPEPDQDTGSSAGGGAGHTFVYPRPQTTAHG